MKIELIDLQNDKGGNKVISNLYELSVRYNEIVDIDPGGQEIDKILLRMNPDDHTWSEPDNIDKRWTDFDILEDE